MPHISRRRCGRGRNLRLQRPTPCSTELRALDRASTPRHRTQVEPTRYADRLAGEITIEQLTRLISSRTSGCFTYRDQGPPNNVGTPPPERDGTEFAWLCQLH